MIRRTGDMFLDLNRVDMFLVTSNATINSNGELVMGRGAAKQLKDVSPLYAKIAGDNVCDRMDHTGFYGLALVPHFRFGLFQVKYHFRDQADLELIRRSTEMLRAYATRHSMSIALNYPGIGNGRLTVDQVEPIIATLPDNVHVWTLT